MAVVWVTHSGCGRRAKEWRRFKVTSKRVDVPARGESLIHYIFSEIHTLRLEGYKHYNPC